MSYLGAVIACESFWNQGTCIAIYATLFDFHGYVHVTTFLHVANFESNAVMLDQQFLIGDLEIVVDVPPLKILMKGIGLNQLSFGRICFIETLFIVFCSF